MNEPKKTMAPRRQTYDDLKQRIATLEASVQSHTLQINKLQAFMMESKNKERIESMSCKDDSFLFRLKSLFGARANVE